MKRHSLFFIYVFLVLLPLAQAQDSSKLIAYFKAQSVSVRNVTLSGDSIIAEFDDQTEKDFDTMEKDILTVSKKLATEFPSSQTIHLVYYVGEDKISELILQTKDVLSCVNGEKDNSDILAGMQIYNFFSIEKILESGFIPALDTTTELVESEPAIDTTISTTNTRISPIEKDPLPQPDNEEVSYLGAGLERLGGEGIKVILIDENSPAQNAGLRFGDLILGIEDMGFSDDEYDISRIMEIIASLPDERPLRFRIKRGLREIDIWIKLGRIGKEQLADQKEKSRQQIIADFVKGKELLDQQDYKGAIELFRMSIRYFPREAYHAIGYCFYRLGTYKSAVEHLKAAYELDMQAPFTTYYLAASFDKLGDRREAVYYYKGYLELKHENPRLNANARKRLAGLQKTP